MMFSTKAEYGVRVMVELARRAGEEGGDPVSLAEIAAHDGLPLAYLEHLVARLRKAGLVDSRRGSRGGYLLARRPAEITMAEVVEALEGSIAPIECISESSDGSIVCSRESSLDHVCPTKLLWTRVRLSIVSTLRQTTLADLLVSPAQLAQAAAGIGLDDLGAAQASLDGPGDGNAAAGRTLPTLAAQHAAAKTQTLTTGA
jgi:Rrf2 family transcriptional regulator, cysteine metabolism repressor